MKFFLTTFIFTFSCLFVNAQQDRFIYLQTENHQPFFVKLNNRILNSNPPGYLIIPKLDDGIYSLVIGFPEMRGEQAFNCSIHEKDVGFIIKNAGEKEWQLLNVQTNDIIVPVEMFAKRDTSYEKETDAFTVMLANAVNDTTLLRKDVAKESKTQIPAAARIDSALTVNTDAAVKLQEKILGDSTEKVTATNLKDSTKSTSLNTDVPKANNILSDSVKATTAQESIVEKTNELAKKDTIHIVSSADVAIAEQHKTDSVTTNPVTPAVADRSSASKKDTVRTVVHPDVVIADPQKIAVADSMKIEAAKDLVDKRAREMMDSAQLSVPNSETASTKVKKKKQKKEVTALPDAVNTKKETVKTEPEKTIEIKDTVTVTMPNADVAIARSVIKRKSKKNSKEGLEMVYVVDDGETRDTIRIIIPIEKKNKGEEVKVAEPVKDAVVNDNKPANINSDKSDKNKPTIPLTEEEKKVIQEANKPTMINSDCKNLASEDDFLKIRKRMVAENNDEDMIRAARKIFRTRCFTTEQVKNLSVLFLKDEGKYMFFEAAYPFVSNSDLYSSLEKQMSDTYYINRFRAMVHK